MSRKVLGDYFGDDLRPEAMLVLDLLSRELDHEIQLNAATGYQMHPRWPAPEVFERPGWDVCVLPPGARKAVVEEIGDDNGRFESGPVAQSTQTPRGMVSENVAVRFSALIHGMLPPLRRPCAPPGQIRSFSSEGLPPGIIKVPRGS